MGIGVGEFSRVCEGVFVTKGVMESEGFGVIWRSGEGCAARQPENASHTKSRRTIEAAVTYSVQLKKRLVVLFLPMR